MTLLPDNMLVLQTKKEIQFQFHILTTDQSGNAHQKKKRITRHFQTAQTLLKPPSSTPNWIPQIVTAYRLYSSIDTQGAHKNTGGNTRAKTGDVQDEGNRRLLRKHGGDLLLGQNNVLHGILLALQILRFVVCV
jgi:hypothetical protein